MKPFVGTDIKATCKEAKFSAAGLDQWATQDFSILSNEAYDWLAIMFNEIEAGAPWPEPTLHAKGAYLLKDPDDKGDPLGYRVLLVMSVPYRRYAATRLRQCNAWIGEWATPDRFAGIRRKKLGIRPPSTLKEPDSKESQLHAHRSTFISVSANWFVNYFTKSWRKRAAQMSC